MNNKSLYTYIILIIVVIVVSIFVWIIPHKSQKNEYDLTSYLNIQEVYLQNGSKGFLSYNQQSEVVALSIIFKGGTFLEPLNKKGITNILNNMFTSSDNDEIKQAIKKYSIQFNTIFDIDHITFDILVTKNNLDQMFKVIKLILEHTNFDVTDLQIAKSEALQKLKLIKYDTEAQGQQELYKALFNSNPRFLNSVGSANIINSFTIRDVIEARKILMTKNNIVFGVSGNVDVKYLTDNLNDVLSSLSTNTNNHFNKNYIQINKKLINVPVDHSTNSDIFIALPISNNNNYPLLIDIYVTNTLLGKGFNSLLVEEVRVKQGLVYSIYSNIMNTLYGNFWVIRATTDNNKVQETVKTIQNVLVDLSKKKYSDSAIRKVKRYMTNSYILQFSNPTNIASRLSVAAFLGKSKEDIYNRNILLQSVKKVNIDNIVDSYINTDNLLIIVSGGKI